MTRQDEKQRLRRRLQDYAIEMATANRWQECIEVNKHILTIAEDAATYNRLGKAYMEQGLYVEAHNSYQHAIELSPTNAISRKNLTRLEALLARGIQKADPARKPREQVDLRLFITEARKTAITTLIDVPRSAAVEALTTSEKVELVQQEERMMVMDNDGNVLGRIEPKLAQRLLELIRGGNQYIATIVQCDTRQVQVLIRETFQHINQRGKVSFPAKLSESTIYGYIPGLRYEYDTEDLLEEDDIVEESDESDDDYSSGDEEEELGLDDLEKDISDDDEPEE